MFKIKRFVTVFSASLILLILSGPGCSKKQDSNQNNPVKKLQVITWQNMCNTFEVVYLKKIKKDKAGIINT